MLEHIKMARKLQATPHTTPHQRRILREFYDLPRNTNEATFLRLRTQYNNERNNPRPNPRAVEILRKAVSRGKIKNAIKNYIQRKQLNQSTVINVDITDIYRGNLRTSLKNYAGKRVKVFVLVDGVSILGVELDVPTEKFGSWWNTELFKFMKDSNETLIESHINQTGLVNPEIKYVITEALEVSGERVAQKFAEGITNCLFTPILTWAEMKVIDAESERSKQRYRLVVKKVKKYLEKYQSGVPEQDLQEIVNDLQIGIKIDLPFAKDQIYIDVKSHKKQLTTFKFINTRLNHIELNELIDNAQLEEVSYEELQTIVEQLGNEFYLFNKDTNGRYIVVKTLKGGWRVQNDYLTAVNEFERQTDLNLMAIDYIADKELSYFVREGCHTNQTRDFNLKLKKLKHIDMTKAYTQFKKCKYYEGFLGKITDFRLCQSIEFMKKNLGYYRVGNFDWSGVSPKVRQMLEHLRIYYDYNIYPSPELKRLLDLGMKFNILEGCWGASVFFEFNEEMLNGVDLIVVNKKEKKLPWYSKWSGSCFSINQNEIFSMRGTREYFDNVKSILGDTCKISVYQDGEGQVAYPKQVVTHKSHIFGFITMYQRLQVLDQLDLMDFNKIRRVCVDGIYFQDHPFKLNETFTFKTGEKLGNGECDEYVSNITRYGLLPLNTDMEYEPYPLPNLCQNEFRENWFSELFLGAGGNGKTYKNILDRGLMKVLYVAPSYELCADKERECRELGINLHTTVLARAIDDKADKSNALTFKKKYSVIIFDEASMYSEETRQKLFEIYYYHKLIFCGDIGFQLPPIQGEPIDTSAFENIQTLKKNYRFKCEKHSALVKEVRDMIADKFPKQYINNFIINNYTRVAKEDLIYSPKDIILCSRTSCGVTGHNSKCNCNGKNYSAEWTERFGETKFKCLERSGCGNYFNGSITLVKPPVKHEVRHGYTVHSVQGKTYENTIFIDSRNLFSVEMGYTAISRARYYDQIKIIV